VSRLDVRASEKRRRRGVGGWGGSPPFLTLFFQTHIYGLSLLLSIVNTAARFTGLRFCSLVRRFLCINITVAPSVLQRGPWKIYKTSLWKSRDIRYYFHWVLDCRRRFWRSKKNNTEQNRTMRLSAARCWARLRFTFIPSRFSCSFPPFACLSGLKTIILLLYALQYNVCMWGA